MQLLNEELKHNLRGSQGKFSISDPAGFFYDLKNNGFSMQ